MVMLARDHGEMGRYGRKVDGWAVWVEVPTGRTEVNPCQALEAQVLMPCGPQSNSFDGWR